MSNSRSLAKLPAFLSPAGVLSPQAGGTGVTSLNAAVGALGLTIGTDVQAYDADLGSIAGLTGTAGLLKKTATNTWTLDTSTYLTDITSGQVTTALGFTPYNSSNPSGYISGITSSNVTTALGFTPYNATNPNAYISGITSSNVTTALGFTPENSAVKGSANGYASLDGSGLVPSSQLPSYVDDVLEYANLAGFPATGTTGKIYVALDTNKTYRWSGSAYIYITSGAVDSVAGKTGVVSLTSSDVGLGNVENKSSATIRSEISSANVTGALGFTPYNATNPSGYISGITSSQVTTALGFTPYNSTNPAGYITGINSSNVTTALGFTPYNATNPAGYITGYTETDTLATVTARGGTTSGGITINSGTNDQGLTMTVSDGGWNYIGFSHGATRKAYFGLDGSGNPQWGSDSGAFTITGNYTTIGTSTRSPIFYDSDNTSYYIDPASNSVINSLAAYGNIETYHAIGAADDVRTGIVAYDTTAMATNIGGQIVLGYKYTASGNYTQGAIIKMYKLNGTDGDYSSGLKFQVRNTGEALATRVWIEPSGGLISDELMQSPIYYDYNSSGYYLDPASTSRLVSTIIGGHGGTAYDTASNGRLYIGTNVDNAYSIYTHLESYGGNYTKLTLDWHTGIKIGAYKSYGGTRFYNNSISSSGQQVFSVGEGDDNVRVSYSLYTPITYDLNDTSYYVDPNSYSRINTLAIGNQGSLIGGSNTYPASIYHNARYLLGFRYSGSGTSNYPWLVHDNWNGDAVIFHFNGIGDKFRFSSGGIAQADDSYRAPTFYDSNDTNYYVDGASVSNLNVLQLTGALEQGNNYAHPNIEWSVGGSSTGEVIFYLPGTTGNYGMVHMVFDIYEYNSPRTATVIVGGHNWGTSWYNTACNVIGYTDKQVRVGIKDGRFVVVFGTTGSTWSYGQVRLRKIQNGSYYNNAMDLAGNWSATQTTSESFSYISGDLRALRTPSTLEVDGIIYGYTDVRSPIYYDYNDTGYYLDPAGTSNLNVLSGPALNDTQLWLRTKNDSNHYLWNASDDYEELVMYFGTGFRVTNSQGNGTLLYCYGSTNGNHVYTPTSFRAPIFYDSNDTGYYVDPNSSSIMNTVRVAGTYARSSAGTGFLNGRYNEGAETTATTGPIYCINATSYAPGSGTSFGNMYGVGYTYASDGVYVPLSAGTGWGAYVAIGGVPAIWLGGSSALNGAVSSMGGHYGSRFYTTGQTAYYCDPAGTTVLNALTVGGQPVTGGGGDSGSPFSAF